MVERRLDYDEVIERALAYDGQGCFMWPFGGRGRRGFQGKTMTIARIICIQAHGNPPTPRHQAAHNCHNGEKGCISKKHLRWATPGENVHDAMDQGTHAPARLLVGQYQEIKNKYENGKKLLDLALEYKVSISTIRLIVKERT